MSEDLGPSTRPRRVVCTLCGTMGEPTTVDADAWSDQLAHENGKEHQARYAELVSIREVPWEAMGPAPVAGDVEPTSPAGGMAPPHPALTAATPESEEPSTPPRPRAPADLRKLAIPPRLRVAAAVWIAAVVVLLVAGACSRTTVIVAPTATPTATPAAATLAAIATAIPTEIPTAIPTAIATPIPTAIPTATATPPPVELGPQRPQVSGPAPFVELVDGALHVLQVRAPDAYDDVVRYLTEIYWRREVEGLGIEDAVAAVWSTTGVVAVFEEVATQTLFNTRWISPYYQLVTTAAVLVHEACHVELYQQGLPSYDHKTTALEDDTCVLRHSEVRKALVKAEPMDFGRPILRLEEEVSP